VVDNYASQGWIKANGRPVVDWKATVRSSWIAPRDKRGERQPDPNRSGHQTTKDTRKPDGYLYRQQLGAGGEVLSERRRDEVPRLEPAVSGVAP